MTCPLCGKRCPVVIIHNKIEIEQDEEDRDDEELKKEK